MSTDRCDAPGVYFGTETGQLVYMRDEGKQWQLLAGKSAVDYERRGGGDPRIRLSWPCAILTKFLQCKLDLQLAQGYKGKAVDFTAVPSR